MYVCPIASEVTRPFSSTVATAGLVLLHTTVCDAVAGSITASSCTLSPTIRSAFSGLISTPLTAAVLSSVLTTVGSLTSLSR